MSEEPPQRRVFRVTTDKDQGFVRVETRNTDVQIELAAVRALVLALIIPIIAWFWYHTSR